MALISKLLVVAFGCCFLFVPIISSASDFGEININLGASLLSRATLLDEKNSPSGYEPDGLDNLKKLADTSLTDDFWKQRYICSFGLEYMHSLNIVAPKLEWIKIGVGTKLIQRSVQAFYDLLGIPNPDGNPFAGGGIFVTNLDMNEYLLNNKATRNIYMLPLYFSVQANPINSNSSFSGLYLKGNIGYNFIVKDDLLGKAKYYNNSSLWEYKREGGLYLGAELGNEFEFSKKCAIILSVYYDYVQYTSVLTDVGVYHGPLEHARLTNVDHSIGVKTGLKFKI
ncbi:MAG: hypothetical protein LBS29_00635 [Endomicrobium sp.]|jgi:hypothetical protein|nr:hypothetical protein [Endomicrobium sp.]